MKVIARRPRRHGFIPVGPLAVAWVAAAGWSMPDGVAGTLDTVAVLVFAALPAAIVAGGVAFVPWRRDWWSFEHWGAMLRRHGWVIVGLIAMLAPEILEAQADPWVTSLLPWRDAPTAWFAAVDGNLHEAVQRAAPFPWLRESMTIIYGAGYPVLVILAVVVPVWLDRGALARRALAAYALSFGAALPFYLLFPVDEVWAYAARHGGHVENILAANSYLQLHLYSFNEVNNCFPSLHTAIAVALAGVLWRPELPRRLRGLLAGLAAAIVVSTVYLGVHWLLDVAGGLVLAAVVVRVVSLWWPEQAAHRPRASGTEVEAATHHDGMAGFPPSASNMPAPGAQADPVAPERLTVARKGG